MSKPRTPNLDTKQEVPKFIRYKDGTRMYSMGMTKLQQVAKEGAFIYGIGKTRIMTLAAEAEAIYKVGNSALFNTEIFEEYFEKFREPARPLPKHVWNQSL